MNTPSDRILPPTEALFIRGEQIPQVEIDQIDGSKLDDARTLQLLMVTPDMHCIKVFRRRGSLDPEHTHDDHTTICCLVSGSLRLKIGDQAFLAEPGDVWLYKQGVPHSSEALEDSLQVEIKSPACRTW